MTNAIVIVTVVFNGRELLARTIESVRAAKREDVRYIVLDGASTDGTPALIEANPDVIDFHRSEPDRGIYDAMNKSLAHARAFGGHVLFLGAGDELLRLPTRQDLENCDVAFGDVLIGSQTFHSVAGWKLRFGNTLHHQGLFIRADLLADMKFDTRYRIYSDFDLNQRLLKKRLTFKPLGFVVAHAEPGGVSWGARNDEVLEICRRNFGRLHALLSEAWFQYRKSRIRTGRTSF